MWKKIAIFLFLLAGLNPALGADQLYFRKAVRSVSVDGKVIKTGMSADETFASFGGGFFVNESTAEDPFLRGSLVINKRATIRGKAYSFEFRRRHDPGPYILTAIFALDPINP